jgi:putative acetyltransferase
MTIRPISVDEPAVLALLRIHLEGMHASSPPGTVYALDTSGLASADISFWGAFDGDTLLGFGALKQLDSTAGEIKSMRTHLDHLRKGVAAALLAHITTTARARGYRRLSLETGSGDAFEPALALYRRAGFVNGAAFGDYAASEFNQFLHLAL